MSKNEFPHTLKIVTVWLLLGTAVFLGVRLVEHRRVQTHFQAQGDLVEIQRGRDGHYHWPGTLNGQAIDFLVDTGASSTAISQELAKELKLESLGDTLSHTAGGVVRGSSSRVDLSLRGGVQVDRLPVTVLAGLNGTPPLLGMDVLGKLHWQQRDGVLSVDLRPAR